MRVQGCAKISEPKMHRGYATRLSDKSTLSPNKQAPVNYAPTLRLWSKPLFVRRLFVFFFFFLLLFHNIAPSSLGEERERERKREREREREKEREREREKESERERQTDRQTDRKKETDRTMKLIHSVLVCETLQTDRQTDRQKDRGTDQFPTD